MYAQRRVLIRPVVPVVLSLSVVGPIGEQWGALSDLLPVLEYAKRHWKDSSNYLADYLDLLGFLLAYHMVYYAYLEGRKDMDFSLPDVQMV